MLITVSYKNLTKNHVFYYIAFLFTETSEPLKNESRILESNPEVYIQHCLIPEKHTKKQERKE